MANIKIKIKEKDLEKLMKRLKPRITTYKSGAGAHKSKKDYDRKALKRNDKKEFSKY